MVKGILTDKEQTFLMNYPKGRPLTDSERHYASSITRKTRMALKDLELILEKLPLSYLLFSEKHTVSLRKPIEVVTEILSQQNYRREYLKRLANKTKRAIDRQAISQQTRNQLIQIIDSALKNVELP